MLWAILAITPDRGSKKVRFTRSQPPRKPMSKRPVTRGNLARQRLALKIRRLTGR